MPPVPEIKESPAPGPVETPETIVNAAQDAYPMNTPTGMNDSIPHKLGDDNGYLDIPPNNWGSINPEQTGPDGQVILASTPPEEPTQQSDDKRGQDRPSNPGQQQNQEQQQNQNETEGDGPRGGRRPQCTEDANADGTQYHCDNGIYTGFTRPNGLGVYRNPITGRFQSGVSI